MSQQYNFYFEKFKQVELYNWLTISRFTDIWWVCCRTLLCIAFALAQLDTFWNVYRWAFTRILWNLKLIENLYQCIITRQIRKEFKLRPIGNKLKFMWTNIFYCIQKKYSRWGIGVTNNGFISPWGTRKQLFNCNLDWKEVRTFL